MATPVGDGVGNIQDLTNAVVDRTMDSLRQQLPARELAALEELVKAGKFLEPKAILSALRRAQESEEK